MMGEHLGFVASAQGLAFGFDGRALAVWSDTAVHLFDPELRRETFVLRPRGSVQAVALSASTVAVASEGVETWNVLTGRPLRPPRVRRARGIEHVGFTRDGTRLVLGDDAGVVTIHRALTGRRVDEWSLPGPLTGWAFDAEGADLWAVVGCELLRLRVDGRIEGRWPLSGRWIHGVTHRRLKQLSWMTSQGLGRVTEGGQADCVTRSIDAGALSANGHAVWVDARVVKFQLADGRSGKWMVDGVDAVAWHPVGSALAILHADGEVRWISSLEDALD